MDNPKIEFTPVGFFSCRQKHRFETPRQGVYAENCGAVILNDDPHLIEACRDLEGVERLWIVFCFHLNKNWRPCVAPPVSPGRRIGVFATRSPYRPNPIGISCVELVKIEKNVIYIRNYDLLDGTPILDIKPYIPAVDAFPDSKVSWLAQAEAQNFRLIFASPALEQMIWLRKHGGPDLENFCKVQLQLDPFNDRRKRVSSADAASWHIGCRTWKIHFARVGESALQINSVSSNYSSSELEPAADDPYEDKKIHRQYIEEFGPWYAGDSKK